MIKTSEYKSLRQVVPSLRLQRDIGKVAVVTEAARYIDHLHKTLIERFVLTGIPDPLKGKFSVVEVFMNLSVLNNNLCEPTQVFTWLLTSDWLADWLMTRLSDCRWGKVARFEHVQSRVALMDHCKLTHASCRAQAETKVLAGHE